MTHLLRRLVREEAGQDIIEYALVAAGIAVLMVPTIPAIGQTLFTLWGAIQTKVNAIPVP
ncbi:MAG: Flp family type IVb pilin [Vicinamibacterales bacterium]